MRDLNYYLCRFCHYGEVFAFFPEWLITKEGTLVEEKGHVDLFDVLRVLCCLMFSPAIWIVLALGFGIKGMFEKKWVCPTFKMEEDQDLDYC
jgi:hypothetical protein